MKKLFYIYLILVLAGCDGRRHGAGKLLEFDLTVNYPEKEIQYAHYFNTSYLSLGNDTALISNFRLLGCGQQGYTGYDVRQGEVLFLDKTGKITGRFNKKGNGPGEYTYISDIVFDAESGEFFIADHSKNSILVTDKSGNFLRSFSSEINNIRMDEMKNYDRDHLITYNITKFRDTSKGTFNILSKKDGRVMQSFHPPVPQARNPEVYLKKGNVAYIFSPHIYRLVDAADYLLLNEPGCDTIYKLMKNSGSRPEPYLVKTPPVGSFDKNNIPYLYPCLDTPDFMILGKTVAVIQPDGTPDYRQEEYFYDKKEGKIYKAGGIYTNHPDGYDGTDLGYSKSAYGVYINCRQAETLCRLYDEGKLEGELKSLAAKLDPEGNPVLEILALKNK